MSAHVSFPVVGGVALEVHWHGPPPGTAPTLVFLHEGLGSAAQWRNLPARLAAATGCGALVYSRAGYGQSGPATLPRPVTYLHHEGLVVLPALLAQLGVQAHVLIGHSDGGSVALINAGGAPGAGLRAVITEAAHVFKEEVTHAGIQEAAAEYETTDLRARLARHHRDVDGVFGGWRDVWLSDAFWDWNLEGFLPGVTVPLLVIQGADDRYGTARQVEAIVAGAGGRARPLVIPDCGHTPHREAAEVTFTAMRAFILEVLRGGPG